MGIHNDRVGELMVAIYVGDRGLELLMVETVVGEKMNVEMVWAMVVGVNVVEASTVKVVVGSSKVKVTVADVVVVVVVVVIEMEKLVVRQLE